MSVSAVTSNGIPDDPYSSKYENLSDAHRLIKPQIFPPVPFTPMEAWEVEFVKIENVLNYLSYIPIVSTISSVIRSDFGIIEMITGIAISILGDPERKGASFFSHGLNNVCRSLIECIPVAGNITCLVYDKAVGSRKKYSVEERVTIQ